MIHYQANNKTRRDGKDNLFLVRSIPALRFRGRYVVFSPFKKQIAVLSKEEFNSKDLIKNLEKLSFFGTPQTSEFDSNVVQLSFNLTNTCNLMCRYCYGAYGEPSKKNYISPETILGVLKRAIKQDTKEVRVVFVGGEPTLNMAAIRAAVEYLTEISMPSKYYISTNGVVPEEDLGYMIRNKFRFNVSHDGLPEFQEYQRPMRNGKPSTRLVERTIKKLISADVKFKVRTTITKYNVRKLDKIVGYLSDLGVKYIHLDQVMYCGRAVKEKMQKPSPKVFVDNLFKAIDMAGRKGSNIISSYYSNLFMPSTYYCSHIAGEPVIILGSTGTISCCYEHTEDKEGPFYLGELKNNKINIDARKKNKIIKNYDVDKIGKCKVCPIKYICGGGCPQDNYLKTGDLFIPNDENCWVHKEIIRRLMIKMCLEKQATT